MDNFVSLIGVIRTIIVVIPQRPVYELRNPQGRSKSISGIKVQEGVAAMLPWQIRRIAVSARDFLAASSSGWPGEIAERRQIALSCRRFFHYLKLGRCVYSSDLGRSNRADAIFPGCRVAIDDKASERDCRRCGIEFSVT